MIEGNCVCPSIYEKPNVNTGNCENCPISGCDFCSSGANIECLSCYDSRSFLENGKCTCPSK